MSTDKGSTSRVAPADAGKKGGGGKKKKAAAAADVTMEDKVRERGREGRGGGWGGRTTLADCGAYQSTGGTTTGVRDERQEGQGAEGPGGRGGTGGVPAGR